MKMLRDVLVLGVALAVAGSASAHHSTAMFNRNKVVTLVGVVKQFYFANPHCAIQMVVPGNSADSNWTVEMGSPAHLLRAGWKRNTLKEGDRITVQINPALDGTNYGLFLSATGPDGRTL
jgi:hypothetical protein